MKYGVILFLLLGRAAAEASVHCPARMARKPSTYQAYNRYTNSSTVTTATTTTTTKTTISGKSYGVSSVTSSSQPTCLTNSTVTYHGTRDPTITITKDETERVTTTPGAMHAYASTYVLTVTPLPPCYSITLTSTKVASTMTAYPSPTGSPGGGVGQTSQSPAPSYPTSAEASNSFEEYTSTAVVTRKTVIPVPPEPTGQPPLTFGDPSNTAYPGNEGSGSGNGSGGGPNPGNQPGGGGSNGGNSGPHVTAPPQLIPGTQIYGSITIIYGSTDVSIGGISVPVPTAQVQDPPKITYEGSTYTILPSQIVAPDTTISMPMATAVSTITQPPSTAVVDGVTVTVGPSQAIISGTSYRIGIPSDPLTVTIDGHTIVLNSRGVVFPSTTLSPALTVGVSSGDIYRIVVVDGITISIEGTDAIISGTTFRIGTAAGSESTVTFGGRVVTVGPEGVVVGSATIDPTSLDRTATITATTGAGPSTSIPTPTDNGGAQSSTEENSAVSSRSFSSSTIALLSTLFSSFVLLLRI